MGIVIDRNHNIVDVKYGNSEATPILFKGDAINQEEYKGETGIKEVTINEGVIKIGVSAFEDCTSLTTVTLPSSLVRIEWNSFIGCDALQEIVLPASLDAVDCWLDGRGVSKMTLFNPSSDDLIVNLKKGYAMDFYYKGESRDDHWK